MAHPRKNFEIYGKTVTVGNIVPVGKAYTAAADTGEAFIISGDLSDISDAKGFSGKVCAVIERDDGSGAPPRELPVIVPENEYGADICYECNIREALGGLLQNGDRLYPKFEKTCGAIMFTRKNGERRYLLIKSRNIGGHIGFPKGHIEYGETELAAAEREIREETGLPFARYGDFRAEYTFHTFEDNIKTGVFFLSEYEYRKPEIQQEEITDDWLLPYEKAYALLNFPEDREILEAAEKYINKHES